MLVGGNPLGCARTVVSVIGGAIEIAVLRAAVFCHSHGNRLRVVIGTIILAIEDSITVTASFTAFLVYRPGLAAGLESFLRNRVFVTEVGGDRWHSRAVRAFVQCVGNPIAILISLASEGAGAKYETRHKERTY